MVEFALISSVAMMVMMIGIQFALIGQAALAVSQGSSALARYAAVNPGALGTNGTVALPTAAQQLLSSSILTNGGSDLTTTIASYSGTSTTTTSSPGYTDRVVITLSYNAASKIALPNPFFGITFPSTLAASDSQMYE
jgi:Flp pilus assembly protein TadG